MKEADYILVESLNRVRIANGVLREGAPFIKQAVPDEEYFQVMSLLSEWERALYDLIEVEE